MRRRFMLSHVVALAAAGAYGVQLPEPEHVLTSVVEHRPYVAPIQNEATILFVGDMMFDRTVRSYAEKNGWDSIFACAAPQLREYDAVVGNLEGPVTKHASVSVKRKVGEVGNTQFTFPREVLPVLSSHGFAAVSIGNNHIRDFGPQGIDETRANTAAVGIAAFGDPRDATNRSTTLLINGISVTLVVFNEFFGKPEETIAELQKYTNTTTIVFAHWGDEYKPASARQKKWAKRFVDAGADAIIGAHPHVVQESELIDGVPVYYSLGNFIFDQYWMNAVRIGKAVAFTITPDGIRTRAEAPVSLQSDRSSCIGPMSPVLIDGN
jgi:gamma-polyglutamate biosynthesis protein CapA